MISLIMWLNNHPQVKKAFRKKKNIFSRNIKSTRALVKQRAFACQRNNWRQCEHKKNLN